MTNGDFLNLDEVEDIESHNVYAMAKKLGIPKPMRWRMIKRSSRDNARTPMQWSDRKNAGFTTGTPWLPVNENFKKINAEAALNDPNSIFYYYQKLIQLRKTYSIFRDGDFNLLYPDNTDLFVYTRENREGKMLVVCNFSELHHSFYAPDEFMDAVPLIANYPNGDRTLRPYEAFILYEKKGS